jgi:hypothetical protein|tara:strand:+ start:118 stop:1986 length:1869 start_codon:yes stop_codon:yes gene_type:complete
MATIKSSNINITDLDFDQVSSSLKEYLKGQTLLKDYDFEGSNLAILTDLLAYSAHTSAFNANMVASEMFLDTAQIRKNVVSRAKELGYTPSSRTASKAIFDLTVNSPSIAGETPNSLTLSRGHEFTTIFDGTSYTFISLDNKTITPTSGTFRFDDLNVYQGKLTTDVYRYSSQVTNQRFPLLNPNIDTSTITINITSNNTVSAWTKAGDLTNISTTSTVFYLQENDEGLFEVYFGDGIIGKEPKDSDEISISYLVTDSTHANGAGIFSMATSIQGNSDVTMTNTVSASGGKDIETPDQIKFSASKFYTSQNRLVTVQDYKAKLQDLYPGADSISVWGGEDHDPISYGKVFVAIKPSQYSNNLTTAEKTALKTDLSKLSILTVRPEIIDAEILQVLITSNFKYDPTKTSQTKSALETLIKAAIISYDNNELSGFDTLFRHSQLSTKIDSVETSVLSNITTIKLKKDYTATIDGTASSISLTFGNALYNPHSGHNTAGGGILTTTGFFVSGDASTEYFFDDDGEGNIRRYSLSGSTRVYKDNTAGTIIYSTGKVSINSLTFTSTSGTASTIEFTVTPSSNDVISARNQLLDITANEISVTGVADTVASGETSAGVGYTTSSSYS